MKRDKPSLFYKFSIIAGTKEFGKVMFPKCLILFLTMYFIVNGGFGPNYLWLSGVVGLVACVYYVVSIIRIYLKLEPEYFGSMD